MRTTITRKMVVNTICGYTVELDSEGNASAKALNKISLYGNITKEQAKKELVKVYGDNAMVAKIETAEKVFEISVEDFIKNAKEVVKESSEN